MQLHEVQGPPTTSGKWEVSQSAAAPAWVATVWANGQVVASLSDPNARSARPEGLSELHANAALIALAAEYYSALKGMHEQISAEPDSFRRTQLLASELVAFAVRSNADMHTPGPWSVSKSPWLLWRRDVCAGNRIIAMCAVQRNTREEVKANAHVIAKAPDMLAALRAIVQLDPSEVGDAPTTVRAIVGKTLNFVDARYNASPASNSPGAPSI
jgi:hypothetical protein